MAKLPKLEHVKYVRAKGRLYAYFNTGQKRDGKPIYARLPAPSAPGFLDSYVAYKAGRTKRLRRALTVAAMAEQYLASSEYRDTAGATQRLYAIQLDKVRATLGDYPVDDVHPSDVREVLDGEGWGAGTRNSFVAVLGALYRWGRRAQKTTMEPCKDIAKAKGGQHEPWPEDILEAALEADDPRVRLAVHLLYFTGQRIGDACALRWGDLRGGAFHLTQQKRGHRLIVPVHSELQAELDRTPRRSITVLTSKTGLAPRVDHIRDELKAFTRALGVETVPHGLRKNAVNALLEAGATIAEVAAITGQTYAVVEHYAARVNNRTLGRAAMLKFERRRTSGEQETTQQNVSRTGGKSNA